MLDLKCKMRWINLKCTSLLFLCHCLREDIVILISFGVEGKPLGTISAVQMDFVQIAFQPPPPQANGPFGATFFAEN